MFHMYASFISNVLHVSVVESSSVYEYLIVCVAV